MLKKDMQKEITKYQGRIYYFDTVSKKIHPAPWIQTLADYDHSAYELHHVVPFTDWEKNTRNVRSIIPENALILIGKVMHQHLENPMYKMSKEMFEQVYGINPDKILYDINSKLPRKMTLFYLKGNRGSFIETHFSASVFSLTEEDLACFDGIEVQRA